jgi:hypothetical protein
MDAIRPRAAMSTSTNARLIGVSASLMSSAVMPPSRHDGRPCANAAITQRRSAASVSVV